MHLLAILQVMVLLAVANGVPVIAKKLLASKFAWPLDCGVAFIDRRPLLGASKTFRGIVLSIVVTTAAAPLLGLAPTIGAVVAATAMAGDLFSSFVKRRLALKPSSRAVGLDQIPESLFPLLACRGALVLSVLDISICVAIFFGGEVVLSLLLYKAHIRDRPY
jgi:CDP-diglyceride synthetase